MAVAKVAPYPLINLDDNDDFDLRQPKTAPLITTSDVDDDVDDDENTGSETDDSTDMTVLAQQAKQHTQRETFNNFLKATEENIRTPTSDKNDTDASRDVVKTRKIIDEVRRYQQELFERALEENVIAVLDTGSGKTLIACLLVRHMLSEELVHRSKGNQPRIVFFLANSVHLVQQQARVLANNLTNKPVVFIGDYKAEVWKQPEVWPEIFDNSTPVVCTPAVLKQCLDGALIRMDQISLLIFDEAHHAKKNHPYSLIIRSHYLKCDHRLRPRVFGMTASPVDSKGNIDANMNDLEELLHCKIVTAQDPSKLSLVPKPRDVVWNYDRLALPFETDFCHLLRTKCGNLRDIEKGFAFARKATSTLGPWCADRVWKYVVGTSEHESAAILKRLERDPEYLALDNLAQRETAVQNVQEAVKLVSDRSNDLPTATPKHLSPKVLRLHRELVGIYSTQPDTRGIVFVDQRFTAYILNDCFQRLKIPNLRSGLLLGKAQDSISLRKQEEFLHQFRVGIINLIFATAVAEEGIDIPQCNLCVRFDLYKSPIQYIQSRGRARMKDSIYAHMIEDGNVRDANDLDYAINSDIYIRQYCERLDPHRLLGRGTRLEKMIARDSSTKSFRTNTGAVCDFDNSLLVLSRFASSLHYLGALEKESYEEEIDEANNLFRYMVRLPKLAEFDVAGARGEWKPNKQLAKRSAAWNCCFILRRKSVLDDSLNSPYKKIKPGNLNARLAITEKKSAYDTKIKPSLWQLGIGEIPAELYLSKVTIQPKGVLQREYSPMGLLTRVPLPCLPTFLVYLENSIETEVSIKTRRQPLPVSYEQLNLLTVYTLNGVFLDVFNKMYEIDSKKLPYWLVPIITTSIDEASNLDDVIDMQALKSVEDGRMQWIPGSDVNGIWTNRFICDPRNGMFRYFSANVCPDVGVFDSVPDTVPKIPQKSRDSIIDFSDSYWKASKKNFVQATYDPHQPVLTAELITARRNFLEPYSEHDKVLIKCLIAPQPLEVSRLDPGFAASCLVWPAIIHRIESYLIALEGFNQLGISCVPADIALEAFTKSNDHDDQEQQTHTESKHGMGKNYERLEFIGDSLLKMMTTITVFNRTKCDEEGMHCRRMEILCNKRLFDVSVEKYQLYQYARTSGFNRATWYPENLVLLKGRGAKSTPEPVTHPEIRQDLGMKTIADISEAIIGAAVTSTRGLPNRFDLGIKAITELVDSEDHSISSWSEIAEMYEVPEWSLKTNDVQANKLAEDVAVKTGYHFNHPRLLRSAFTHSSDMNALVPDLQRLEFLGDAVLDWVSISWLFDNNPDRGPQWLTEHKMAMVSNKFLAALAVVLDFDKFIYCSTAKLYADVTLYAATVRELFAQKDISRDFWTRVDSPPKALSDLVESYLGAVLVDSNFNYDEIEKFFNKHVLWFFEDISKYDTFANRHPTTYLYKKLTDEFKCRDFNVIWADTDDGQVEPQVTAGVIVHNKVIADSRGTSTRYAKVRASKQALSKLEGLSIEEFRKQFSCDCKIRADLN